MAEKDEGELLTSEDRSFARSLKEAREERGITQGELAQMLRDQGFGHLSQVAISRIEQLKRAARLGEARAIARALGVPLEVLDSPPNSMLTILRTVIDGPSRAVQELDAFRDHASFVAKRWVKLREDIELVEGLLRALRERGRHDPATEQMLVDYLEEAEVTLSVDPLLNVVADFEEATKNAQAADADQ